MDEKSKTSTITMIISYSVLVCFFIGFLSPITPVKGEVPTEVDNPNQPTTTNQQNQVEAQLSEPDTDTNTNTNTDTNSELSTIELYEKLYSKDQLLEIPEILELLKQIVDKEQKNNASARPFDQLVEITDWSHKNCQKLNFISRLKWLESQYSQAPNVLKFIGEVQNQYKKVCAEWFEDNLMFGINSLKQSTKLIVNELKNVISNQGVYIEVDVDIPDDRFVAGTAEYLVETVKKRRHNEITKDRFNLAQARKLFSHKFMALLSTCYRFREAVGSMLQVYKFVGENNLQVPELFSKWQSLNTVCNKVIAREDLRARIARRFIASVSSFFVEDPAEIEPDFTTFSFNEIDDNQGEYELIDESVDSEKHFSDSQVQLEEMKLRQQMREAKLLEEQNALARIRAAKAPRGMFSRFGSRFGMFGTRSKY